MKKLLLLTLPLVAVLYFACDSNKESLNNEYTAIEKSRGPVIITYKADSTNCIQPTGKCEAQMIIDVPQAKRTVLDSETRVRYSILHLKSENHEGGELTDFPEIYYDSDMTGIGVGIYIPAQKAEWLEETDEYVLKFLYR